MIHEPWAAAASSAPKHCLLCGVSKATQSHGNPMSRGEEEGSEETVIVSAVVSGVVDDDDDDDDEEEEDDEEEGATWVVSE